MAKSMQLLKQPELIRSFKAVFFDLDGTIFNSEPLHAEALVKAAHECEVNLEGIDPLHDFLGMPDPAVFRFLVENNRAPSELKEQTFIAAKNSHYLAHCCELSEHQWRDVTTPGVYEFVSFLKEHNILTAIVSASEPDVVAAMLGGIEIAPLFDNVVARGICFRSKPSPGPYLHALRHWHLHGDDVLVLEDSPTGKEAARLAGCHVVAVNAFTPCSNDELAVIDNFFRLIPKK